jgi:2-methylisocitrate lyase-like PEP mutase family enzyme
MMMLVAAPALAQRFRELHAAGTFIVPNPWDVGSARILVALGFDALATTSAGFAASLGRTDQSITRDELLRHVESIVDAVDVPVSVDAENGFADDPDGVADTVTALAAAGAAGCSIEDAVSGVVFDERGLRSVRGEDPPEPDAIYPMTLAVERIAAAAQVAAATGLVLTARADNHVHGLHDLADTIERLVAYRDAGGEVLYAPGLADLGDIARVVEATQAPVNVLALPHGPSLSDLAHVGVRRVSVGASLAGAAYSALVRGAQELVESGTSSYVVEGRSHPHPFSLF